MTGRPGRPQRLPAPSPVDAPHREYRHHRSAADRVRRAHWLRAQRFKIAPGGDVLIGLAVIVVVLAVPKTRAMVTGAVWPHLRDFWPRLVDALSHPLRLAVGVGANLLLIVASVVAMVAVLRSVGAHPAILATVVVFLAGNVVGAPTPTPGGLGGVEAVLAAGLTTIGSPAHEAIPAVLLFRIGDVLAAYPVGWICI